jgi:hypothetical protein
MKRLVILLLVCMLAFTGCVSSENKQLVRNTVEEYFNCLNAGEYDKANKMTAQADEKISSKIEDIAVNDLIFKGVSYEIWDIKEQDGYLVAEIVVTQISLKAAYVDTVKEYAKYVEDAQNSNKSFTDQALEQKWNEIFYKHVSSLSEKTAIKCDVLIKNDGEVKIMMTAAFRNALFGGELDAINALGAVK